MEHLNLQVNTDLLMIWIINYLKMECQLIKDQIHRNKCTKLVKFPIEKNQMKWDLKDHQLILTL